MSAFWHNTLQRTAGQVSAGLACLGDRARGGFGILVYHRVAERTPGMPEPSMNVTPAAFQRQIAGLRSAGYQIWPLERVQEHCQANMPLPPRVVVITFDDGHRSVFTGAWPVLRELQVPATIFLNTAFLDATTPFPFDRWANLAHGRVSGDACLPLTIQQCREMAASGLIELGAHTHTHADFRGRAQAFDDDLKQCVAELRERFGIERPSFAFPFGRRAAGYVDDDLLAAAKACGVSCALTTECGLIQLGDNPFGWGRFNVYDWDTPRTIAARLRGWYDWAPRWQDRLSAWRRSWSQRPAEVSA
jgi:peptidoglycan/xylan/chitin deacetylase (PgdA/CDA1 family)